MKRALWLVAALLLTTGAIRGQMDGGSWKEVAGTGTARVAVSGRAYTPHSYTLRIAYQSFGGPTLGDALLVYGEPSHTLLLAHVNSAIKGIPTEERSTADPLVRIYGTAHRFSHEFSLPYNPKSQGDTRIAVVMRSGGKDILIADGTVNVREFSYVTTFSVMELPDGTFDYSRTHCCQGTSCNKICTTCDGAFFTCDLINCTIECNYL
jgi:hypothetical protein